MNASTIEQEQAFLARFPRYEDASAQVSYAYDADMWRVKKQITGSATTCYLRDPGGRLLTEWQNSSPNATVKDYIYAGSRLIAVHTSTSLPQK